MTREINTTQSILTFYDDYIVKEYKDNVINKFSSIKNEIKCANAFGMNVYAPEIIKIYNDKSYSLKRYDFDLGNVFGPSVPHIKRMLFTISLEEFIRQIAEIKSILIKAKIVHRDINPGNILFSEKDKCLKLIDFYWAELGNDKFEPASGLNSIYTSDDNTAFDKIKKDVISVDAIVKKKIISDITPLTKHLGEVYLDGSAASKGYTYSKIDIPSYFDNNKFHKDTSDEYNLVVNNLSITPNTIMDVGAASGYHIFNMMRTFNLDKAIAFEADPHMFGILNIIKDIFFLNELELYTALNNVSQIEPIDIVIFLNSHMWLFKQSQNMANSVTQSLIKNCKEMYFQTAGAESGGMYQVKSLKSQVNIEKYLYRLGAKNVKLLKTTFKHGGKRHMFKVIGGRG